MERSSGKKLRRYEGHSDGVTACAYSPDGSRILSASWDKTLREWDRSSGKELGRYEGHSDGVNDCAYSPDGSRILSAYDDGTIRIWNREDGICCSTLYGGNNFGALAVWRKSVAAGDSAGNIWILDCDFC